VQVVISDPDAKTAEELKGSPLAVVSEPYVIDGLGHLFPRGDLAYAHLMDPPKGEGACELESIRLTFTLPREPAENEASSIRTLLTGRVGITGRRVSLEIDPLTIDAGDIPERTRWMRRRINELMRLTATG
jgi:hypothetical protein